MREARVYSGVDMGLTVESIHINVLQDKPLLGGWCG
jgi:hypothetical protein